MQHIHESIKARTSLNPQHHRRGFSCQRRRRATERSARRYVIAFERWGRRQGLSQRSIAQRLGISTRTLRQWKQDGTSPRQSLRPRGRRIGRSDRTQRNQMIATLRRMGIHTGVGTLQGLFPGMPRREVQDLKKRYVSLYHRSRRRGMSRTRWVTPGAVWATDHTTPDHPVDGIHKDVLAVRDLASRTQLAWHGVPNQTGKETRDQLQQLFEQYGTPLVIKTDNGSGFTSADVQTLLEEKGVVQLLSPPRTPRYNGGIEGGNHSLKVRTNHEAEFQGRPDRWQSEDLEAVRQIANHTTRHGGPNAPTPAELFESRPAITGSDRRTFFHLVHDHKHRLLDQLSEAEKHSLDRSALAKIDRSAVERALVESGQLKFQRRPIPLPNSSLFATQHSV